MGNRWHQSSTYLLGIFCLLLYTSVILLKIKMVLVIPVVLLDSTSSRGKVATGKMTEDLQGVDQGVELGVDKRSVGKNLRLPQVQSNSLVDAITMVNLKRAGVFSGFWYNIITLFLPLERRVSNFELD